MGNIGLPELLVILVVAFLCLGPQRLPDMARALGEAVRAFRQALNEAAHDPAPPAPEPPLPAPDARSSSTSSPHDSTGPSTTSHDA